MSEHPGDSKVGVQQLTDLEVDEGSNDASGHLARVAQVCSPSLASSVSSQPTQIELLLKAVESDLIPRLYVNHMMDVPATSPLVENRETEPAPGPWSSDEKVAAFAALCIGNDPELLDKHVTDLLAQGVTLESIFLYLLTPTARYLGEQWSADELSFVDVHLGLCRLHQLICECETIGYRKQNLLQPGESILLTCAPGENHTFGVTMVADFFRRYGWQVSNLCGLSSEFVIARLESTEYAVVGFSLHNQYNYEALAELVNNIRIKSCNKDLIVMVGGDYFIRHPNKVEAVGADIFATDGRQAILKATEASKKRDRAVL